MKRFTKKRMTHDSRMPLVSAKYSMFILLLAIFSCNSQKKSLTVNGKGQSSGDSLVLLVQDNYAPTDSVETLVIRDEAELRQFFTRINMTRKPGIPVPEVDFSKEMVLIFCAGTQKDAKLPPLSIFQETEDKIVVSATEQKLNDSSDLLPFVSPFSVYKMPVTKKEVVFKLAHR
jgi:hypothetical protein